MAAIYCPSCNETDWEHNRSGAYWDTYRLTTDVAGEWATGERRHEDYDIQDSEAWKCAAEHPAHAYITNLLDEERLPTRWPPPNPGPTNWFYDDWLDLIQIIADSEGEWAVDAQHILDTLTDTLPPPEQQTEPTTGIRPTTMHTAWPNA